MQPLSQVVGAAILVAAAGWYRYYADGVELRGVI
jgi:hypothetical protein